MFLSEITQKDLMYLLAGNTQYIEDFKLEGLELKKEYFKGDNQRQFKLMEAASKEGYEEITEDYSMIHKLVYREGKPKKGEYLDIKRRLKQELENIFKTETENKINNKLNEYQNVMYKERERVERELIDTILQSRTTEVKDNSRDVYDIIKEDFVYVEGAEKIPTYLKELDEEILQGGLPRNQLSVISALSGHGKTTFGAQMGTLQAVNNYKVLFLSLEQDRKHIATNVISILSEEEKEDKVYFSTSNITKENEEEIQTRSKELVSKHLKDRFVIDDSTYETQDELMKRITRACLVEQFDVVIIDNFQNEPGAEGLNEYQSYKKFADSLMNLARNKDHKTAILAMSQLSENSRGTYTKGARVLNDNAATQLKITRPEITEEDRLNGAMDTVEIFSEKARFGKLHRNEEFSFIGEKGIIGSIALPDFDEVEANNFKAEKEGYIKERANEDFVNMIAGQNGQGVKKAKEVLGYDANEPINKLYEEEKEQEDELLEITDDYLPFEV